MNPLVYGAYKFEVVSDRLWYHWQSLTDSSFLLTWHQDDSKPWIAKQQQQDAFVNNLKLHWRGKTVNRWYLASKALYLCLPLLP